VIGFLRLFVMLAVVRKGGAPFARDLIGALAAAGVVIPVLKLLEESLLHFGCGDSEVRVVVACSYECHLSDALFLEMLSRIMQLGFSIHPNCIVFEVLSYPDF
jgi:hypothetical protein